MLAAPIASEDKAKGRGWGAGAASQVWSDGRGASLGVGVWGAHNCNHLWKVSSRTTLDFSCWGTVTSGDGDQEQGDQL